jgi:hypothetical protein
MSIGEQHFNPQGFKVASVIRPFQPVALSASVAGAVIPCATWNVEAQGINGSATGAVGDAITVYGNDSIVEAIAGASLGPGADVGVGSTNGVLAPVAQASGVVRNRVGKSLEGAAAGERFSVYVNPARMADNA